MPVAEVDFEGCIRVARQQVRLATRGIDRDEKVALFLEEVPVKLSRRGKPGRAGRAGMYMSEGSGGGMGYIVINVGVCYTEERFFAVLYHELAHAVCEWLHGDIRRCHGPEWKAIMVQLGQEPKRCHNYADRR
jgi:hypothetical protein